MLYVYDTYIYIYMYTYILYIYIYMYKSVRNVLLKIIWQGLKI